MHVLNGMLALAGDRGNQAPLYNVTPAEIAVLRAIHGDEAVTDLIVVAEEERTSRAERKRLLEKYGRFDGAQFVAPAVERLFPGAAARVFERIDELELPDVFFKALSRAAPADDGKPALIDDAKSAPQKTDAADDELNDGIEDLDDNTAAGPASDMFG